MNYWVFIATSQRADGRSFTPDEVLQQRMKDKFWGLGERTPNRKNLQKGDEVVFYLGTPLKCFAATATLASAAFALSEGEQDQIAHGTQLYRSPFGVRLEQTNVWEKMRPAEELRDNLDFIENKEFWGTYFQGGVRQIAERDYRTILHGGLGLPTRPVVVADLESESEFALETHLEEFLDQNWDNIDFGMKLQRYQVEEQSGRQFPAGPWSIDFLCTDRDNGDFVVIELKRGKTSDSAVGQVLRYMTYVKRNLAKPGQGVRGVIIAKEVDEALRYAIEPLDNVSVLTYRVDFRLSSLSN